VPSHGEAGARIAIVCGTYSPHRTKKSDQGALGAFDHHVDGLLADPELGRIGGHLHVAVVRSRLRDEFELGVQEPSSVEVAP
jgi:hypothetical protein